MPNLVAMTTRSRRLPSAWPSSSSLRPRDPAPRERSRVGKISALYADNTAITELSPLMGMMSSA